MPPTISIELPHFRASVFTSAARARVGLHRHSVPSLAYLLRGALMTASSQGPYLARAHTWHGIARDTLHEHETGAQGSLQLLVEPTDDLGVAVLDVLPTRPSPLPIHAPFLEARSLVSRMSSGDPAVRVEIEGAVLSFVGRLAATLTPSARVPAWLRTLRKAVERHPFGDLNTLVQSTQMPAQRVHRAFRIAFGSSLSVMARERRLAWVAAQLVESDARISWLALEAGFVDESHLSRHFRKQFGVPPGAYRRLNRSQGT